MSDNTSSSSLAAPVPPRPLIPDSIRRLKSLLQLLLRVTIDDGRIFIGTFVGTDKQLNVLLINSEEYRVGTNAADGNSNGRFVGQVMIPWRLVKKVEAPSSREGTQPPAENMFAGSSPSSDDDLYT